MRSFLVGLLLVVAGCSSSGQPPPPVAPMTPTSPQAAPVVVVPEPIGEPGFGAETMQVAAPNNRAASVTATIGGKPFVAQSALMVRANEPFRACSSVLTGTGGCSTDKDGFDITISKIRIFERVVTCAEIGNGGSQLRRHDVELRPNERSIEIDVQAKWPVATGITFGTDVRDPRKDSISVTFKNGWNGGAIAKGASEFTRATARDGTIRLKFATSNPNLPTSGSASGSIPFAVCP